MRRLLWGLFVAICPGLPILAQQSPLPMPSAAPVLEIHGAISNSNLNGVALFDMAMLRDLPVTSLQTSTAVTDGIHHFTGFLMRDLLAATGASGGTVTATALNDYVISFDIAEFDRFDVLVAYEMDGMTLLSSDKGPLWIIYPRDQHPELADIRYDYRWVWQLTRLDIE